MALLWIEGFEAFGTVTGNAPVGLQQKWDVCSGDANYTVQVGRKLGQSIRILNTAPILRKFITNAATVIVGFGFYQDSLAGGPSQILKFWDGMGIQCTLEIQTSGLWKFYRGTSTLLGTSVGSAIVVSTWAYVEIQVLISNTVGTVDIWVNSSNVLSLTGQNTRGTTVAQVNGIEFAGSQNSSDHTQLDDIYILDSTGSLNNARLGDKVVKMIVPASDGGTNQFTPDSGTNHWDRLTDNPIDTTTYLEDITSNDRELFNLGANGLATVNGVQMNVVAKVTDNTVYSIKNSLHTVGGTDSDGGATSLADTQYQTVGRVVETNPATGVAWLPSEVDTTKFGFKTG